MPFNEKVRSGVLWALIQSWGMRFGGLIVFMLLARILSPSELGLFAAATTVIAFCALFVESGLSEAVVQRSEITNSQLNGVFAVNLILAIIVVTGVWVGANLIADYMKLPDLVWILRLSSVGILIGAFCFTQNAMHRRNFNFRFLAKITLLSTVFSGVAAIFLATTGAGAWSLVAQSLVASTVTAALLWREPQWKFSRGYDFRGVRPLMHYGVQRLATTLLDFANTRFIELFFATTHGAAALGLYVVGSRIYQSLMQILCSAVLDVAHSTFSRLSQDPANIREAYYKAVGLSAIVAAPVFVVAAAVSDELTLLVFGDKWSAAAAVMKPMLLLGALQSVQYYNGITYNAMGRPSIGLWLVAIKTILTLSVLFLNRLADFHQVVTAYILAQLAITPLSFGVVRYILGISFWRLASEIWPFSIAMALSYLCVVELRSTINLNGVSALIILVGCASTTYLAAALLLGGAQMKKAWRILRGGAWSSQVN